MGGKKKEEETLEDLEDVDIEDDVVYLPGEQSKKTEDGQDKF